MLPLVGWWTQTGKWVIRNDLGTTPGEKKPWK